MAVQWGCTVLYYNCDILQGNITNDIPQIFDAVLYYNFDILQGNITNDIPQIFDAVFECTLEMINKDFEEFPEHRTNFFLLLQAVNTHCFQGKFKFNFFIKYTCII